MKKVLLFFILLLPVVFGHLESGIDKKVGNYTVDFGYTPEKPSINKNTILAFSLVDPSTEEAANVSSVWIRISKEEEILFAGDMMSKNGLSSFSYRFPERGEYEITARFYDHDKVLAETDLPITLNDTEDFTIAIILGIIALGIYILLAVKHKK